MLNIKRIVCNPFQENCYILSDDTKVSVIIDCGAYYATEREEIVTYIRDNGLKVKHLLATHAHIDHNFGNNTIFEFFDCKPEIHYDDAALMESLPMQNILFFNSKLDYSLPSVGSFFTDNDVISFGKYELKIIHTPGHSPGSVVFYCEEEKIAFSGDTLFKMSIGRTDLEGGSYEDIIRSINELIQTLPYDTKIYPGHGPDTTIGFEAINNPYIK